MNNLSAHGQPPAQADNCQAGNKKVCLQRCFTDQYALRGHENQEAAESCTGKKSEKMGAEIGPRTACAQKGQQPCACSQGQEDFFQCGRAFAYCLVSG